MRYRYRFFKLFPLLLIAVMLCSCSNTPAEPTTEPTEAVTEFSLAAKDASELAVLENYPSLTVADLRGSTCYDAILSYMESHPNVTVLYDVAIGSNQIAGDSTEIVLSSADYTLSDLTGNLPYLKNAVSLSLPGTSLSAGEIHSLQEAFPGIAIDYTLMLLNQEIAPDVTSLNLSALTPDQVADVCTVLSQLPSLQEVELMDAEGLSQLATTDVKLLMDAVPNALFHYSFDLFGQTISTQDERVEFLDTPIGNEGMDQIRAALDILPNCSYFLMDDCGVDNELMAALREDYPEAHVVWRVYAKPFSMLTDETMLRLTFELNNTNIENLKYMNEVTYMDIGHNEELSDISFVQYMPKLECVILSGSIVEDISYLENCTELVWLEMCFCYRLSDISVLEDHPTLKYLNVSYSQVSDLTPLENVALERLNCMNTAVDSVQQAAFVELHPDCISVFKGEQPYGYGWRYNDHGYTFFDYYANMRIVFRYDDTTFWGNHKKR